MKKAAIAIILSIIILSGCADKKGKYTVWVDRENGAEAIQADEYFTEKEYIAIKNSDGSIHTISKCLILDVVDNGV